MSEQTSLRDYDLRSHLTTANRTLALELAQVALADDASMEAELGPYALLCRHDSGQSGLAETYTAVNVRTGEPALDVVSRATRCRSGRNDVGDTFLEQPPIA